MGKITKIKNLELGTEVKYGGMIWIVKKKDKDANTVTLALEDSIRNMEFDAAEPGNLDEWIADYGNNNYALSNVRQWLNADGKDWFIKTHEYDAPPSYADKDGFMSNFRKKELKRITPKRAPGNDNAGDFFYLPSEEEAHLVTGEQFDRNWVWTSTPGSGSSYIARNVNTSGALHGDFACNGNIGVRPLCDLKSGAKVKKSKGTWIIYTGSAKKKGKMNYCCMCRKKNCARA